MAGKLFHDVCQNSHKDAINKLALFCEDLDERLEALSDIVCELKEIVMNDEGEEIEDGDL